MSAEDLVTATILGQLPEINRRKQQPCFWQFDMLYSVIRSFWDYAA